jgi:hypothetical protein
VDDATVQRLQQHWLDGWNGEDVDTIMAPYADDVVFASPFVTRVSGDPTRASIVGAAALRDYVDRALRRTPGIRYTLDDTFVGTDSLVLLYTCRLPDGATKRGADSMRLNARGQIVDWRCHYTAASMD